MKLFLEFSNKCICGLPIAIAASNRVIQEGKLGTALKWGVPLAGLAGLAGYGIANPYETANMVQDAGDAMGFKPEVVDKFATGVQDNLVGARDAVTGAYNNASNTVSGWFGGNSGGGEATQTAAANTAPPATQPQQSPASTTPSQPAQPIAQTPVQPQNQMTGSTSATTGSQTDQNSTGYWGGKTGQEFNQDNLQQNTVKYGPSSFSSSAATGANLQQAEASAQAKFDADNKSVQKNLGETQHSSGWGNQSTSSGKMDPSNPRSIRIPGK